MTGHDAERIYNTLGEIRQEVSSVRETVAGLAARVDAAAATATEIAIVRRDLAEHEVADAGIQTRIAGSVSRLWWAYGLGFTVSLGAVLRVAFA
jgi:methyl coenzyme M reductase subunit C-like uncharacterized protein (methanogenesis marker protein 7)